MELGAVGADLSIEVIGGGLGSALMFVLVFLRHQTTRGILALWRAILPAVLPLWEWARRDCERCWQQLRAAPLPLQVAAGLFVLNGWGIAALDTYASGLTIGWLNVYPMMFLTAMAGVMGYGLVLRFRRRRVRSRTKMM